jgi:hypothetical protein
MNEETYEIEQAEKLQDHNLECRKFEITINNGKNEVTVTAYRYKDPDTSEDKISFYATKNDGTSDKPIYQDLWYIKLTVKKDSGGEYVYINFIRTLNLTLVETIKEKIKTIGKQDINFSVNDDIYSFKVVHLLEIVKEITKQLKFYKIFLQDDAEFPCNSEVKYGIKALQLRALKTEMKDGDLNKLSIYNRHGYTISKYKNTEVIGCITALQKITCKLLLKNANNLRKLLIRINEKDMTINIQKMTIKDDGTQSHNLKIEYSIVNEIDHSSICNEYIKNLDELIGLLNNPQISEGDKIGDLYDKFCEEKKDGGMDKYKNVSREESDDCCGLRGKLLGCLKNSINSYVIVISGKTSNENKDTTCCDSNLKDMNEDGLKIVRKQQSTPVLARRTSTEQPQQQTTPPLPQPSASEPLQPATKTPIIVTKLFNLFSGTFEKLTYIFFHMENILPAVRQVAQ